MGMTDFFDDEIRKSFLEFEGPALTLPKNASCVFDPYKAYGLEREDMVRLRQVGMRVNAIDACEISLKAEEEFTLGKVGEYSGDEKLQIAKAILHCTWIYFVASVDAGLIKIGQAKNLRQRLSGLTNGSPVPLSMICAIRFVPESERWLHVAFDHLRDHGEWFRAEPELTDVIRVARDQGLRPFLAECVKRNVLSPDAMEVKI